MLSAKPATNTGSSLVSSVLWSHDTLDVALDHAGSCLSAALGGSWSTPHLFCLFSQGIPPTAAILPSEHVVRAASDDDDSSPAVSDVESAPASRRRTQQQDASPSTALPDKREASNVEHIDFTAVPKTGSSAWPTPMLSPFASSVQHHPDATRTQEH